MIIISRRSGLNCLFAGKVNNSGSLCELGVIWRHLAIRWAIHSGRDENALIFSDGQNRSMYEKAYLSVIYNVCDC